MAQRDNLLTIWSTAIGFSKDLLDLKKNFFFFFFINKIHCMFWHEQKFWILGVLGWNDHDVSHLGNLIERSILTGSGGYHWVNCWKGRNNSEYLHVGKASYPGILLGSDITSSDYELSSDLRPWSLPPQCHPVAPRFWASPLWWQQDALTPQN